MPILGASGVCPMIGLVYVSIDILSQVAYIQDRDYLPGPIGPIMFVKWFL